MNSKPVSPITNIAYGNPQGKAGQPAVCKNSIAVLGLSRKRRSGSCDSPTVGQPFINPVNRITRATRPRRSFFRTATNAKNENENSVQNLVNNLSPSQSFRVAMFLRINPPNALKEFVSRVSPQDSTMIDNIRNAIYSIIRKPEDSGPIDYGYVDCRYSTPQSNTNINLNININNPISLGENVVNFTFTLPTIPSGLHIVMQPFILGQTPPTVRWPVSMRILVNEQQIKPPGFFPFSHIDLTTFGSGANIRVYCGIEQAKFVLFIRLAQYTSFQDIVLKIQNEKPAINDQINPNEISLFSPMSGGLLRHPGRGIQCAHSQCFDLKEYIERCSITQQWMCPICRRPVHVGDLMYSLRTKALIYEMTKAGNVGNCNHFSPNNGATLQGPCSMPPTPFVTNNNKTNSWNNNGSIVFRQPQNFPQNNIQGNAFINISNKNMTNSVNNEENTNVGNLNVFAGTPVLLNNNSNNNRCDNNIIGGNENDVNNNGNSVNNNDDNNDNSNNNNHVKLNNLNNNANGNGNEELSGQVNIFEDHGDTTFGFNFIDEDEEGWNF